MPWSTSFVQAMAEKKDPLFTLSTNMSHVTTNKWNNRHMYIFSVDLLDIFIIVIVIDLQFLNNVIIIKTKVLLPQTYVILADFDYTV
jgi:hypothetical protein